MRHWLCGQPANQSWPIKLCADGGRKRILRLCDQCDAALNDQILMMLGDKRRAEKMNKYRQKERL